MLTTLQDIQKECSCLCVRQTLLSPTIPVMSPHVSRPRLMEICHQCHMPRMNKRTVLDVAMRGMTKIQRPTSLDQAIPNNSWWIFRPIVPSCLRSWVFSRCVTWLEDERSDVDKRTARGKIGDSDMAVTGTWMEHKLSRPPFDNLRTWQQHFKWTSSQPASSY